MKKLNFIGTDTGFGFNNTSAYAISNNSFWLFDCGGTVFSKLFVLDKKNGLLKNCDKINVIITHLHSDHVGSLGTFILYCYMVLNKKVYVHSACKNIRDMILYFGCDESCFEIVTNEVTFIKTEHSDLLDCYGVNLKIDGKNIVYTGDSNTLEPFLKYIDNNTELYLECSSKASEVHLYIEDIIDKLIELSNKNVDIYLMHIDDYEKIGLIIKDTKIHIPDTIEI